MIFAHTLEKVLQGKKWQTRRLVKSNEQFDTNNQKIVKLGKRTMYKIGKSYAVQPNRGKKAVARIRLTGIRKEHIREITEEDAHAEGYNSIEEFFATWYKIHGNESGLDCEVWVFEFELQVIIEDELDALYEERNREDEGSYNSYDISSSVPRIQRACLYSRNY